MEKLYKVQMNSKGAPDFSTAVEVADRPSAVDLSSVYSTAYRSGYEKGKADRPQGEWIPCKERLPKEAEPILVTINGKTFFAPFGINEESSKELGVVAWMPLPEPWKGADDE